LEKMAKIDFLLMPSAVAPSLSTPFQSLAHPETRFQQTIRAVKKWSLVARKHQFRIIVVDNTGYIEQLRREILNFAPESDFVFLEAPPPTISSIRKGKGAGESESILFALKSLSLPSSTVVAKVNARYFVTNAVFLAESLADTFDLAAWPNERLDMVDTSFFLAQAGFLESLMQKVLVQVDDVQGQIVESLYAKYAIQDTSCNFARLKYSPAIVGQSGTTGKWASRWNEARTVSVVVRFRNCLLRSARRLKLV
jgi:hypothetical protein